MKGRTVAIISGVLGGLGLGAWAIARAAKAGGQEEPGTAPLAGFSASIGAGYAPLSVKFTDASTGDIISRSWDFGDGGTSIEKSPTHIFTTPGVYEVVLAVTGPGGQDSASLQIEVLDSGEPEEPEEPEEPGAGRLTVKSTPAGASVTIDGVYVGITPVLKTFTTSTSHSVLISKSGYQDVTVSKYVEPGDDLEINLTLTPVEPAEQPVYSNSDIDIYAHWEAATGVYLRVKNKNIRAGTPPRDLVCIFGCGAMLNAVGGAANPVQNAYGQIVPGTSVLMASMDWYQTFPQKDGEKSYFIPWEIMHPSLPNQYIRAINGGWVDLPLVLDGTLQISWVRDDGAINGQPLRHYSNIEIHEG
ncbi:MAG: PKD domain-containing protein [Dehalococcoidales bacterium]|nr:PKD domain-containing protein [Dehalococcoidales bacterium]